MNQKELIDNIKYVVLGIVCALVLNKVMGFILSTELPIVAVMSGSMVHDATAPYSYYEFLETNFNYTREEIDSWPIKNGFRPGDVLIIKGIPEDELKVGDTIVFTHKDQPIPIIHRIVYIDEDGYPYTKGDHNTVMDPDCTLFERPVNGCWERTDIKGKAVLWIPFLGVPKLLLNYLIVGVRGLL